MAASSSLQHRHGMVYLDDSSSGEFSAEADGSSNLHHNYSHQKYHPPQRSNSYQASATRPSYQQATNLTTAAMASPLPSSRGEGEDSYDEIYTSSEENSYFSDEDDLADYWDPYLYRLQLQAPKPNCIPCLKRGHLPDKPPFYGSEYHGSISREETAQLLGERDGNYLVRKGLSQSGTYSLSFVFEKQVRHYKLYYEDGYHYVGEKPFDTIEDLVQDGLIILYMEANNVEEYLQSARETRISREANLSNSTGHGLLPQGYNSSLPENHTHYGNERRTIEPVPGEDESLGERLEGLNVGVEPGIGKEREPAPPPKPARLRKPQYQPCTIPLRRDRTNLLPQDQEDELNKEDVEEEVPPVHNRERRGSTMHYSYAKPHNFKLHNYISMMSWCDYCRNFMWGLRNQGYKCKDCGYNAHKLCKDDTAHDCQPSHQRIKRVYGVDLTTLVTMEGHKVPSVIRDTIQEIERRGLEVEGIYRMSGKKNDILRLKCKFDSDMSADLSKVDDIHALTGALKLYLRELPIPLVTFDSYDLCLIAVRSGSDGECLDMLHKALDRLPPAHYNSLKHLMRHLHEVQLQKEDNRMDSKNLALVFTPSLMRSPHLGKEMEAMQKLPEERKALDLLIQHFQTLFS